MLRKAMAQQEQFEHASDEQKAKYEQRLLDMADRLKAAEEKRDVGRSRWRSRRRRDTYTSSPMSAPFGDDVYKIGLTRRWDPMSECPASGGPASRSASMYMR